MIVISFEVSKKKRESKYKSAVTYKPVGRQKY